MLYHVTHQNPAMQNPRWTSCFGRTSFPATHRFTSSADVTAPKRGRGKRGKGSEPGSWKDRNNKTIHLTSKNQRFIAVPRENRTIIKEKWRTYTDRLIVCYSFLFRSNHTSFMIFMGWRCLRIGYPWPWIARNHVVYNLGYPILSPSQFLMAITWGTFLPNKKTRFAVADSMCNDLYSNSSILT